MTARAEPPAEDPPAPLGPRFPGYDVLSQQETWDDVTKGVVLGRLGPTPPIRFFTPEEEAVVRPLVDRLLGMDGDPRVAVVERLDSKLTEQIGPGYRHDDMPEPWEAWRASLAAVDDDARAAHGVPFADLDPDRQRRLLEDIRTHDGNWHGLPAAKVWTLWMDDVCTIFYSHPSAWNEIGYGGPAYPRGYSRHTLLSTREPWEAAEADAMDPVPWAQRVEEARRRQS
ncbi:MAG TPA: gluconate 2-dehydrogenase subunit 3 family protein [Acidimicrobiales bacterium]|nr:gluconate 2-dehydrogenase subunit 3 family protein [Acidimicrobiales bacterium]